MVQAHHRDLSGTLSAPSIEQGAANRSPSPPVNVAGMGRGAIILSVLIAATQILPVQALSGDDLSGTDKVAIRGATEEQAASLTWAIERFDVSGLELPALDLYVHGTKVGCDGHDGLYTPGTGSDRIDICTEAVFIILHELAHAWEYRFGTDEARQQLLDELGLEAWTGADVSYRRRGEEVAANVVAWGLIARGLTEPEADRSADTLERFEALTGVPSPRLTD